MPYRIASAAGASPRPGAGARIAARGFASERRPMGFLTGKRLLVTGLLSNRSIAYGIAKACHRRARSWRSAIRASASRSASPSSRPSSGRPSYSTATSATTRRSTSCSPTRRRLAPLRRLRAFDRLRAARGDRRRLPRRPVARGVPRRARHRAVQLPRARQGCAARLNDGVGAADADLSRRDAGGAELQHDGAREGVARGQRALPRGESSGRRASASTASAPGRSRRWPPAASRASARCSTRLPRAPRSSQRDDRRRRQRRRVPADRPRRRHHGGNHLRRWRLQPRDGRRRGRSLGAARPLSESRWRRLPRIGASLARVERRDLVDLLGGHRARHVAHLAWLVVAARAGCERLAAARRDTSFGMPSSHGAPSLWSVPPWQEMHGAMLRSGSPTRTSAGSRVSS